MTFVTVGDAKENCLNLRTWHTSGQRLLDKAREVLAACHSAPSLAQTSVTSALVSPQPPLRPPFPILYSFESLEIRILSPQHCVVLPGSGEDHTIREA